MADKSRKRAKLPRAAPTTDERLLAESGYEAIAGVDEAGVGALAGPVVAAAVVMPLSAPVPHLTDSKLLTARIRDELYDQVRQYALECATALCAADLIDRINILEARLRAMQLAVEALSCSIDFVLVDGHLSPPLHVPCRPIIGGDRRCRIIAAASIIAKVTRDRLMTELDDTYPQYGFAIHKGYATPQHLQAIAEHGPCLAHRMTFAPMKHLAQQTLDFSGQ
jgi:ribonuclease HII